MKGIAQKSLSCGKIKKVFSHAYVCSLEQRARNTYDQNKQTIAFAMSLHHWKKIPSP